MVRLDNFTDEFGDCITMAFDLVTDPDQGLDNTEDLRVFTKEEIYLIKTKFEALPETMKETFVNQFEEVKNVISPTYKSLFDAVVGERKTKEVKKEEYSVEIISSMGIFISKVQQVTEKTICALFNGNVIDFNRVTGEARGKAYKGVNLAQESVSWINETVTTFHSGISRFDFPNAV